jgi:tetratricopeptide (TPR) repeat protein
MASEAASAAESAGDRQEVISALERQLAATPRHSRPYDHARIAYRLGLAHAEAPAGSPTDGLRRALAHLDVASKIFDPELDPIEHARVLNAAGAAHRGLGDRRRAANLFERAAELLGDRGRDDERAAALNNLGLVRAEQGQLKEAVDAFDQAAELFDTITDEGRRGLSATIHNRGQTRAAMGTPEALHEAVADFRQALQVLGDVDAPYHRGLAFHSLGVAFSSLAGAEPAERQRWLAEAVEAFTASLDVFTRSAFPFQHALAKHNLGLAYLARGGGVKDVRRALASFEDAVAVLDPRLHADPWRQAYASMSRVEEDLGRQFPGVSRPEHFAALAASVDDDERHALVQSRVLRLLSLPEPRRHVTELALASAKLPREDAQKVISAELKVLVEQPTELQQVGLRARFDAHQQLVGEPRRSADRALDDAIVDALQGPQRIWVRDFLYSLGWERPQSNE